MAKSVQFTPESAARISKVVRRVEGTPVDLRNTLRRQPRFTEDSMAVLKITGATVIGSATALAGGVYRGRIWKFPSTDVTVTGSTFSATTLGSDPGADNAYFFNLAEMGKTTHDLTSTSNSATLVIGLATRQTTDGYQTFIGPMAFPGCS